MADFKKMTVETLRDLARRVLGPGQSKKTKGELIQALEGAGDEASRPGQAGSGRAAAAARSPSSSSKGSGGKAGARKAATGKSAAGKAAAAAGKAADVAQQAGAAAREGARAVARAGKATAQAAAAGARQGAKEAKTTRTRRSGKVGAAVATVAGAAAGAAAGIASARKAARSRPPAEGPDPEGYFVARVRGEDAVREAPHPMTETGDDRWTAYEEGVGPALYDEQLGDLPWGYGDDAFVALPRDPRTLFLYWDLARETLARGFAGLDHPRAQLWVFARAGSGWDRLRAVDFALESRGYYVHDLEPGRTYRAEIHVVDRGGNERLLGASSNEVALPPVGPSPLVDDRFIRIPWDLPLGRLLGPGHAGGPFSDEARALLARLSDWSRFSSPTWGGSAGGMGGRPFSPTSSPSSPPGDRER
jgi:hypothetical protein